MPHYFTSSNQKWYYLLKGSEKIFDNNTTKYYKGLLDDYPLDYIESKLVVCASTSETERYFSLFESYIDFIKYYETIDLINRHFYEVIFGELPQKPHFDLDFNIIDNEFLEIKDENNIIQKISSDNILD